MTGDFPWLLRVIYIIALITIALDLMVWRVL